jgi:hypothetical protein
MTIGLIVGQWIFILLIKRRSRPNAKGIIKLYYRIISTKNQRILLYIAIIIKKKEYLFLLSSKNNNR